MAVGWDENPLGVAFLKSFLSAQDRAAQAARQKSITDAEAARQKQKEDFESQQAEERGTVLAPALGNLMSEAGYAPSWYKPAVSAAPATETGKKGEETYVPEKAGSPESVSITRQQARGLGSATGGTMYAQAAGEAREAQKAKEAERSRKELETTKRTEQEQQWGRQAEQMNPSIEAETDPKMKKALTSLQTAVRAGDPKALEQWQKYVWKDVNRSASGLDASGRPEGVPESYTPTYHFDKDGNVTTTWGPKSHDEQVRDKISRRDYKKNYRELDPDESLKVDEAAIKFLSKEGGTRVFFNAMSKADAAAESAVGPKGILDWYHPGDATTPEHWASASPGKVKMSPDELTKLGYINTKQGGVENQREIIRADRNIQGATAHLQQLEEWYDKYASRLPSVKDGLTEARMQQIWRQLYENGDPMVADMKALGRAGALRIMAGLVPNGTRFGFAMAKYMDEGLASPDLPLTREGMRAEIDVFKDAIINRSGQTLGLPRTGTENTNLQPGQRGSAGAQPRGAPTQQQPLPQTQQGSKIPVQPGQKWIKGPDGTFRLSPGG